MWANSEFCGIHGICLKRNWAKMWGCFWTWRKCPFSQFEVLMSSLNCEKDRLLGQIICVQKLPNILSGFVCFLGTPFKNKMQNSSFASFWNFPFIIIFYFWRVFPFFLVLRHRINIFRIFPQKTHQTWIFVCGLT